jgi:hypothetical protein
MTSTMSVTSTMPVTSTMSVVFSTDKTERHDIPEISLKVAFNTHTSQVENTRTTASFLHFPGLVLLTHKYMTVHFPGLVQALQ